MQLRGKFTTYQRHDPDYLESLAKREADRRRRANIAKRLAAADRSRRVQQLAG